MKKTNRYFRTLLVLVIAFVLVGAAYAFTAGGTTPSSTASLDSGGAINSDNVSAVSYTLDATDPTLISGIDLTLASAVSATATVKAQLDNVTPGTWYDCTEVTTTTFTCTTAAANETTVLAANALTVVVTD